MSGGAAARGAGARRLENEPLDLAGNIISEYLTTILNTATCLGCLVFKYDTGTNNIRNILHSNYIYSWFVSVLPPNINTSNFIR